MSTFVPSARTCAIVAIAMFAPVVASYVWPMDRWWLDYPGILFHLAIFLLVPQLPAPGWAKAAGYGWLVVDVTVGVMTLNHVPSEIAMPIRLGGHIFAGLWIVNVSLLAIRPIKFTGLIAGGWLAAFSFVSPFVPKTALAPTALLMLLWLGLIAWHNGSTGRRQVRLITTV
ncbi:MULTISPECIES: hypothetical protein [unclassified Pseudomonas]|uniref:hypothetical protein n=1 Tax=unclassified Pseudomonas TaxID=196821 RepID=UPI0015A495CE|nr:MULTISPECIES: hypothetical protein [unclassified Pseudomonas]NWC92875.1 hypothetical protein [Pseudomonas sp. IPO3779]NWD21324.1 hypothetical protein [Pseudomonas sp. IPO3778]